MSTRASDQAPTDSAEDHRYFLSLEEAFVRLRGAPLLLSPADWQIAKAWRRKGVPLELAVRVMEQIFERKGGQADDQRKGIRSLKYFDSAVARAWTRISELGGADGAARTEPDPIDIRARLLTVARSLPSPSDLEEPKRGNLERALHGVEPAILELTGETQAVESALRSLDEGLLENLTEGLDPATRAKIEDSISSSLGRLSERVSSDGGREAHALLFKRYLRREFGLDVLSLFSSRARDQPPAHE